MIHFFNPGHETAVLNASPYYMAPANVATMQRELAFLPAWYASRGDCVLVENQIEPCFDQYLVEHLDFGIEAVTEQQLLGYKNEKVALWGVSPQAIHFFEELSKAQNLNLQLPVWHDRYTYLNSRMAASDCLVEIRKTIPLISSDLIPHFCSTLDKVEKYVECTQGQLLTKAPYSSSGRGLLWLPATGLTRTERQILHGILKKQGSVAIEKVLDKEIDFAMEFAADGNGNVHFLGYSLFSTNKKGAYEGNFIGSQSIIIEVLQSRIDCSLLERVKATLTTVLSEEYAKCYEGCIGVDMMVYKDDEEYRLHPCLEINMRSNMGLLALRISENYISKTSKGQFKFDFSAKDGDIYLRHQSMQQQYPAHFQDKRLAKGYLPLCPIAESSHYTAYLLID